MCGGTSLAVSLEDPPTLSLHQLEETEQYQGGHLWDLLDDLRTYAIEFEASVRLLQQCTEKLREVDADRDLDEYWLWSHARHIPARDAALTVYHFGWTLLTSIPETLRRCPTISLQADHVELRAARGQFEERLGNYSQLRHAVGHRAELRQSTERKQANAALNKASGYREIIWGNLERNSLVFTIKGKRVSLAVTCETHQALVDTVQRTFGALPNA